LQAATRLLLLAQTPRKRSAAERRCVRGTKGWCKSGVSYSLSGIHWL
jgi:hypothetical protein